MAREVIFETGFDGTLQLLHDRLVFRDCTGRLCLRTTPQQTYAIIALCDKLQKRPKACIQAESLIETARVETLLGEDLETYIQIIAQGENEAAILTLGEAEELSEAFCANLGKESYASLEKQFSWVDRGRRLIYQQEAAHG